MKITLLQRKGKVEEERFSVALQNALNELKGDLTVEIKIQPFSKHGWTALDVTGDDCGERTEDCTVGRRGSPVWPRDHRRTAARRGWMADIRSGRGAVVGVSALLESDGGKPDGASAAP